MTSKQVSLKFTRACSLLKNTINVPPTAYSKYGSVTTIFVARDVDFSDVYELATP